MFTSISDDGADSNEFGTVLKFTKFNFDLCPYEFPCGSTEFACSPRFRIRPKVSSVGTCIVIAVYMPLCSGPVYMISARRDERCFMSTSKCFPLQKMPSSTKWMTWQTGELKTSRSAKAESYCKQSLKASVNCGDR